MKTKFSLLFILIALIFLTAAYYWNSDNDSNLKQTDMLPVSSVNLDGNNISSSIWNTGVIDQNNNIQNYPGFEWPIGSGHYAIFTAGLTLGAYVNNQLRLAAASYKGEYTPGYCVNGTFQTNANFRLYKVRRIDNPSTPDWANWGLMVPYGAPFVDVNHNGIYEPAIDTPGVRSASQTVFVCLTDANPLTHDSTEGFSGGTAPIGAEVHLTAWCYDNPGYQDMNFVKWVVINKNTVAWDSTIASVVSDPDLGYSDDDYVGCDTTRNMGYCYNADNNDAGNSFGYGLNPPAVGIMFLNCMNANIHMKSFGYFTNPSTPGGICERDPSYPAQAYWMMKGFKNDGTPYVIPNTNPPVTSKYNFPGDPETGTGWTEFLGNIINCGDSLTGFWHSPSLAGDRRFVMSFGTIGRMNPSDTQIVCVSQLIARGSNNKNSVTLLKQIGDAAIQLCGNGFVIGITPTVSQVPKYFNLYQNYPNPFNPETKIKFDIATPPHPLPEGEGHVILKIYDALGREVAILVNEQLKPGTYEVTWDATNYPSGVYFYKLQSGDFSDTKKLILLR